ncbi:MAG: extracellular solute-binding protein [Deltaproteobacteria bacterium]|nr:MAG: extracellular solute-binding protein [Deltaproteobacteria bacterium]
MKTHEKSVVGLLFGAFLLMIVSEPSTICAQSDHTSRLVEGAKKEGTLLWYTALNLNDSDMLTTRFEQIYPFIKTETLRLSSFSLLSKIQTEARTGAFKADVIEIAGVLGHILKKDGLLAKYISPESRFYPDSMKDSDGTWTSFFINTHVLVYNTMLVKKDELPRSYAELINPKWKDKIAVPEDFDIFGMMLKVMGREKGLNFMRRLAAQGVSLRESYSLAIQGIASSEIPLGVNLYGTRTEEFKKKGAPVDWIPLEFVLASLEPLSVAAKASHPNSAQLFVDFLLSKEAQSLMRTRFRIPSRPDVPPDPPELTKGLKLIATDLSLAEQSKQLAEEFRQIFKSR